MCWKFEVRRDQSCPGEWERVRESEYDYESTHTLGL